jgi:hypothetical protein
MVEMAPGRMPNRHDVSRTIRIIRKDMLGLLSNYSFIVYNNQAIDTIKS